MRRLYWQLDAHAISRKTPMNGHPSTRLRLLALLSKLSGDDGEFAQRLARRRPALANRFGREARVLLGVRRADDPFSKVGGDRKVDSAEAILQVSWPGDSPILALFKAIDGLADDLRDVVDIDRSALAVGTAYF